MRRSLTALLTIAVVLLAANLVVQLARPAQAQTEYKAVPHVVGFCADGSGVLVVYRLWSDGTVDANDTHDLNSGAWGPEQWKGWKVVK